MNNHTPAANHLYAALRAGASSAAAEKRLREARVNDFFNSIGSEPPCGGAAGQV